jgi:hypothetical protein
MAISSCSQCVNNGYFNFDKVFKVGDSRKNSGIIWQVLEDWSGKDW